MSEIIVWDRSFKAGADLTGKQFFIVKADTAADKGAVLAGATDRAMGVLQTSEVSGRQVAVRLLGETEVIAGADITRGAPVRADANGRAVTAGSGEWAIAEALESVDVPATPLGTERVTVMVRGPFKV